MSSIASLSLAVRFCGHRVSCSLLIPHGVGKAVPFQVPNSVVCREISRRDKGILALKLVRGSAHQLFYRKFSTTDDYTPLPDVARYEILS